MTDRSWIQSRWIALTPLLAALLFSGCVWTMLNATELHHLMHERGPVEQASWRLWLLMALAFAVLARPDDRAGTRVALAVMMAAFFAREEDFHKEFTGTSVLKVSFYFDAFALHQKLIAGLALVVVFAALAVLVKRHGKQVWRGIRRGDAVCTTVLIFVVSMVISKLLDRSMSVLEVDYGIVTPQRIGQLVGTIEESIEAVLPVIAGLGLMQHLRRR